MDSQCISYVIDDITLGPFSLTKNIQDEFHFAGDNGKRKVNFDLPTIYIAMSRLKNIST